MTKRASKKVEPSLWGFMVAINSEEMPLTLAPLADAGQPIVHHECNRAAGVDVPVNAEEVATP